MFAYRSKPKPEETRQLQLQININEYNDAAELPVADQALLRLAHETLDDAYAPYSNFKVGAAVLLANGKTVVGTNQENAAYSMCMCAERTALAAASSVYPNVPPVAIAITAKAYQQVLQMPVTPCGACRQVIAETESRYRQAIRVIMQGEKGVIWKIASVKEILPLSFDAAFL